jgi:hypothetical protein
MKTAKETLRDEGIMFEHEDCIVGCMDRYAEEYSKAVLQYYRLSLGFPFHEGVVEKTIIDFKKSLE